MKFGASLVTAVLLLAGVSARCDIPVFGSCSNSDANVFSIAASSSGEVFGGAVGFTPLEDLSLASVTVWLNGYTGQNNQYLYAEICRNASFGGDQPGPEITALTTPSANDGSTAGFTFCNPSGTTVLDAGQEYWLAIYGMVPPPSVGSVTSHWVEGSTPSGNAVFNGAEGFSDYSYYSSAETPAFTINAVPEPSTTALMILPGLFLAGRAFFKRRK